MLVVTRSQLRRAGATWDQIEAQVQARRWQALNSRVVCRHNGTLTRPEQLAAVLLSARPPAALCGLTALELWGLRGHETTTVHLLVRRGARPLRVPGVRAVVHESRRFDGSGLVQIRQMAVTEISRSVVDACAWTADGRAAARILVDSVQQRLAFPDRLDAAVVAAGRVRHAMLLRSLLADMAGGAEALSEVAFVRFCRRHRLPLPELQVRVAANGRRRRLDAQFVRADGRRVLVEIDGGVHLTLRSRWNDTRKDNWSAIEGRLVLRFPSVAIYTDDPEAIAQLRAALA